MALPLIALTHHAEEETLTDAEFEFEILRQMDTDAWYDKASRDKAMQAAKGAASSGYAKTKAGAKAAAEQAKKSGTEAGQYARRTMAGAKLATNLTKAGGKELAKRLIKSYKMYIEELGWKAIQESATSYHVIYAESGLMVHAKIVFRKSSVRIEVVDSSLATTKRKTQDAIFEIDKPISFAEVTTRIDQRMQVLADDFASS